MHVLCSPTSVEITIKKSVFKAEAFYIDDAAAARAIIKSQKKRYSDARHVVHAFVIGSAGNILGCSDDGEPSGTAGQPALAVLKGSGITNILVTVTRWFGGTLLGTGGLVKAYTHTVKAVLDKAAIEPFIEKKTFLFSCPYEDHQRILHGLAAFSFTVSKTEFTDTVTLTGTAPAPQADEIEAFLTDTLRGKVSIHIV